jgi:hypothetical protein
MLQKTNEQALALALVVILNWLLAHLATNWTMPPEVANAAQSVITIVVAYLITPKAPAAPTQIIAPPPPATAAPAAGATP